MGIVTETKALHKDSITPAAKHPYKQIFRLFSFDNPCLSVVLHMGIKNKLNAVL